jgi:hypothetical protein
MSYLPAQMEVLKIDRKHELDRLELLQLLRLLSTSKVLRRTSEEIMSEQIHIALNTPFEKKYPSIKYKDYKA